jgi:hypothetical protein
LLLLIAAAQIEILAEWASNRNAGYGVALPIERGIKYTPFHVVWRPEFEIVPVPTSAKFWSKVQAE